MPTGLLFWTVFFTIAQAFVKFLIKLPWWAWVVILFIGTFGESLGLVEKVPQSEASRLWDVARSSRKEVPIKPDLVQAYAGAMDQEYTMVTVINNSDDVINDVIMVCRRHDAYENPPNNPHKWDHINYKRHKTNMIVMPHNNLSYKVWGYTMDSCTVEFKAYTPKKSDAVDFADSPGLTGG